jgi:hypothetical protein
VETKFHGLVVQNEGQQGTVDLQTSFGAAGVLEKPGFRNRLMKKFARDRVVPAISAKLF